MVKDLISSHDAIAATIGCMDIVTLNTTLPRGLMKILIVLIIRIGINQQKNMVN